MEKRLPWILIAAGIALFLVSFLFFAIPKACAAEAANNSLDKIVSLYRDKASGTNFDRTGWRRLEADLAAGMVNWLVVWRLDRLGRSAGGRNPDHLDRREREAGPEAESGGLQRHQHRSESGTREGNRLRGACEDALTLLFFA